MTDTQYRRPENSGFEIADQLSKGGALLRRRAHRLELHRHNGVATVALPPGHRGANRTYEAVFEGDDYYLDAAAERKGKGQGGNGGGGGNGGALVVTAQPMQAESFCCDRDSHCPQACPIPMSRGVALFAR